MYEQTENGRPRLIDRPGDTSTVTNLLVVWHGRKVQWTLAAGHQKNVFKGS